MQQHITIGDIFREHGPGFIHQNNITGREKGIINLLAMCRTGGLGSHFMQCSHCLHLEKSHNSCRNRHCPVCQQKDKQQWLEKRMEELLPVGYYHLVFTIPHQLNLLCLQNKKILYDILFKAASQTVLELANDNRHMGANTGLVTVLHTWGQNMMEHPHLHCIMPTGGFAPGHGHWVHAGKKGNFFVHYKVLSRKFRGKFLDLLQQAFDKGLLSFKGNLSPLAGKRNFSWLLSKLYKMEWIVNIQRPLGNPGKILEYLSRYVFRVAIANSRIIGVQNGKVSFWWKDSRTKLYRKMKLEINEFVRRFLLHLLPDGFFKVRYYGIFSSRYRKQNIQTAKSLLDEEKTLETQQAIEDKGYSRPKQNAIWEEIFKIISAYKQPNCPRCKKGRMVFAGIVHDQCPGVG
jgi:hypothetical protein